ncbi:GNAT family N-acetyltransferase [Nioella aestuarii]|uniref:GNAT family N-acetyltransferase n=1 Tax=Nioella aestuarii TaxID=1662864 RepID=UPI003D7F8713
MTDKRFGASLTDWEAPPRPRLEPLDGRYARLVRLDADLHAADLHRANSADAAIWDYLPYGPFSSAAAYHRWIRQITGTEDPLFYAVQNRETGHFGGVASFLRITPEVGVIEVGHINFAPELQRTRAATEALFLMMEWVFKAGYRRFEWKCDALNMASRRAAQRLGFSYEGIFRQATIVKGRNRDTAWFACIDSEWPALREAYNAWLSPSNFTADGVQIEALSDLTRLVRAKSDPAFTRS